MSSAPYSRYLVFDGQGLPAASSPQAIKAAKDDAQTSLCSTVLVACYEAFVEEYESLTPEEQQLSGLVLRDLPTAESLLELPVSHSRNAIVANTHLFLSQLFRVLQSTTSSDQQTFRTQPFSALAFSTGIFAAVVLASSASTVDLVCNAVVVYKTAFWLGMRAELYAVTSARASDQVPQESSWSIVLFGATRAEVEHATYAYNKGKEQTQRVYLTAVTHATCISVSGRPESLDAFKSGFLPDSAHTNRSASIYTLYHSPDLADVKARVALDLERRNVRFPSRTSLHSTIYSTITGEPLGPEDNTHITLVEEVLDMILIQPVNFDLVLNTLRQTFSTSAIVSTQLINVGPGNSLWRNISQACSGMKCEMVDWSFAAKGGSKPSVVPATPHVAASAVTREPIAIVGMAVKFPGADDADELWNVLEKGLNTVSEVPNARFKVSDYTSGACGAHRSMKTCYGNFIRDPDAFDNAFFRVSPREARSMDPQQRLLLQVSYHALENAGYVPNATPSFNPDTFATYVGVATNDYTLNLKNDVDVYYSTGTLQAFLSGKISYAFGFSGPSVVIDTACSSSMVAIYQACRALQSGDCNAAIAGGVNITTSPDMYIGLDRAHFLSPTGQCKPWDASADGYCRSEGCGMFVLKRLSDALAENDNILGVIRGIEVNQSANAESITHPHPATQIKLFEKLVHSAGVDAGQVSVVEAHGTGTRAGDPTELESITHVFGKARSHTNPLHLTGIKGNIGHAEAASGAASLAKLLLMMRHHAIPACISLKQLNPAIGDFVSVDSGGLRIDTALTPWVGPGGEGGRLALLNNFGAAGSNAALILQEFPPRHSVAEDALSSSVVVGISCDTEAALEEQRQVYMQHLTEQVANPTALADLAYTATARRKTFRYRLAAHGRTVEEVCASLRAAQATQKNDGEPKVVFVFSGQGSQYPGMGVALYRGNITFRKVIDHCHDKLVGWGFPGIREVFTAAPGCLDDLRPVHCSIFALECALSVLWTSWGVPPAAVAGQSLGEYAALVTAGVLSLDDGLRLVAGRAQLIVDKCAPDTQGMLAVKLSSVALKKLLLGDDAYDQLSIACYNSCEDTVVAGDCTQLVELSRALKASGHRCTPVNTRYAFHSAAMDPVLESFSAIASSIQLSPPTIPVVSNAHGIVVRPCDSVFTPSYFARHCREPSKFQQGITGLLTQDDIAAGAIWLELGPHSSTLSMVRSTGSCDGPSRYLPSLRRHADGWQTISAALAEMYCLMDAVQWREVFRAFAPNARLVELPVYPFAKTRYWVPYTETSSEQTVATPAGTSRFSLLESCVASDAGSATCGIDMHQAAPLILGHKVAGHGLCPASVYIEAALAATRLVFDECGDAQPDGAFSLSDMTFQSPWVHIEGSSATACVNIDMLGWMEKRSANFRVQSSTLDSSHPQVYCSGVLKHSSKSAISAKLELSATMIERRVRSVMSGSSGKPAETFHTRTIYEVIFSRVVHYSSIYRTLKSIMIDPNGVDAYAIMSIAPDACPGTFVAHPLFVDTLLHAAGFVINCNAGPDEAFICNQIDKVRILPDLVKCGKEYGVYCNLGFLSETMAVADAYAFELGSPNVVVAAHIKRMRFQKVRMASFGSVLSASATRRRTSSSTLAEPALVLRSPPTPAHQDFPPISSHSRILERTKELLANVLGITVDTLPEDQDLSLLGMDSLMSIEALHALHSAFGVHLPGSFLSEHRTLRDIAAALDMKKTCHGRDHEAATMVPSSGRTTPPNSVPHPGRNSLEDVRDVLAAVLGVSTGDLADDRDLAELGMDSLMSIEARHAIHTKLGITLPGGIFAQHTSIRNVFESLCAVQDIAERERSPDSTSNDLTASTRSMVRSLVKLQDGRGPPLFLIHDGSGTALPYSRLAPLGCPVWGIHNPKFHSASRWEGGLLEMAAHYSKLIQSVLSAHRKCLVGGWSIGGVIAFEVARQLTALGTTVDGLILIDSPHPLTDSPLSARVLDTVFPAGTSGRANYLARTSMCFATEALVRYDPRSSSSCHVPLRKAVALRCQGGCEIASGTQPSDVFLRDRSDPRAAVDIWEQVTGLSIPIIDIPGNHFDVFSEGNVSAVSRSLVEAISLIVEV